ncbi:MinD/ParA family protein [Heliophilum fasciatum]|uniref:Flagellar biosynthesis protein FlhG n=1 Tax=Heliophilum fasciatum TaxID=35700 RepID=A0A4R2RQ41_9FIRM|nr:MinD/ParA family protein [Heliophilum fasciatum]MCW2277923.1 flagellar biosynthesis protein FlhG [Heliophilum fasciatum]TCP64507.1 flagellar biosynthesis protein FlhG [Heliophilum fasciatum]
MNDQAEKLRTMMRNVKRQVEEEITGKRPTTRIICISSGKGGVGKTNVTLNLGLALTEYGQRVMIIDADMGMANIDVILGKVHPFNLYHVFRGEKQLRDIIFDGPNGIRLISGGSGIAELANLSEQELDLLIAGLADIENATDILLIDTGAGISRNVLSYIYAADELIVVTTPEPTSITDAYGLIKSVVVKQKNKPISLIVNRVENNLEGEMVTKKLSTAVERFLNREIKLLGFIPEDVNISKAVKQQTPFYLQNEQTPAAQAISILAAGICRVSPKNIQTGGMTRLFMRVKQFFA